MKSQRHNTPALILGKASVTREEILIYLLVYDIKLNFMLLD
jgi:hypothetical protein